MRPLICTGGSAGQRDPDRALCAIARLTETWSDIPAETQAGCRRAVACVLVFAACAAVQFAVRGSDAAAAHGAWIITTVVGSAAGVILTGPRFGRARMAVLFSVAGALSAVTHFTAG